MNTADRSVAVLDQALRRRFHFVGLFPGETPVADMLRRFISTHCPKMGYAADVLDEANRRLGERHTAIGPSHLMRRDLDHEVLQRVWRYSVMPTIEEHLFGVPERMREFELDALLAAVESTGHGAP